MDGGSLMKTDRWAYENLEVYVWEGKQEIADRITRFPAPLGVEVIRAGALEAPPAEPRLKPAIAVISVSVIGNAKFTALDWEAAHGMPVVWVAAPGREGDPGRFPPEYAHILSADFSGADLRGQIGKLLPQLLAASEPETEVADPVAESPAMRQLLEQVDTFADFPSNVMLYGDTGAGKERIARLFHERNRSYGKGRSWRSTAAPFPTACSSRSSSAMPGAFTGAMYAHRGYFEQANGGTLFLDEIGDLPMFQQVAAARAGGKGSDAAGLDAAGAAGLPPVAATNKDLREAVGWALPRGSLFPPVGDRAARAQPRRTGPGDRCCCCSPSCAR